MIIIFCVLSTLFRACKGLDIDDKLSEIFALRVSGFYSAVVLAAEKRCRWGGPDTSP